MKKPEIARRLAREAGMTEAEAADQLDRVVHEILTNVRSGQTAALPGLGRFCTNAEGKMRFQKRGVRTRG
jgi:nucleoid DNA-binding protein